MERGPQRERDQKQQTTTDQVVDVSFRGVAAGSPRRERGERRLRFWGPDQARVEREARAAAAAAILGGAISYRIIEGDTKRKRRSETTGKRTEETIHWRTVVVIDERVAVDRRLGLSD